MVDQDANETNDPTPGTEMASVEENAEVVPLPGIGDVAGDRDEFEWSLGEPDSLDDFTSEEYVTATTQEYQGLAEEVSRAAQEEWQQQAVAAMVPGVGSGLVGFEDVSGMATQPEEAYEAVEQAATSDLAMRVASALGIFGMFLGSLFLGEAWFSGFVVLVMVVSLGELYATLRVGGYRPLALFGLVGVIAIGVGAHSSGPSAVATWGVLATVAIILFFTLTPRRNPLSDAAVTVMGMAWVGMLAFAIPIARGPHPLEHILFLVLVIALNDTGAYFTGRTVGKRKLAPSVSPSKTVEGFVGGLVVGVVAAAVMALVPPWLGTIDLVPALVVAGVVGILSPLGDLSESMIKRSLGVKDMGSVLPGHGGMLDRIDGFLFAVPAIYVLFRGFGLL